MTKRRAFLVALAGLLALLLALVAADLIAHPRDRIAAVLFACGALFGWALDNARR
jgi:hypothetical protein